ncbi:hypothetical protein B9J90_05205 [Vibrio sp. V09_P4A23P171]|nr:hypothetical protein B9J90_05205 [Vibrio sp. V09_P4A23P171]
MPTGVTNGVENGNKKPHSVLAGCGFLFITTLIPFLLEAAAVLATFVHPNHIVCLCSWGLTHLPPTCNSKLFRYITIVTV